MITDAVKLRKAENMPVKSAALNQSVKSTYRKTFFKFSAEKALNKDRKSVLVF